jgi:stearoyl-CoA desaturase (delta-9 desaturase)
MRIVWGAAFVAFYAAFATAPWQWLLLPGHWIMGAMHGAIVNWAGTLTAIAISPSMTSLANARWPIDFLTGGELYQNNHHKYPKSPNFAALVGGGHPPTR